MRFARVRSGLMETIHDVAGCAIDASGTELTRTGDVDREFFYRSAVKPFQASASLGAGIEVTDEQLAVICSSHGGFPVHLGLVRSILADHGRSEDDLRCPAATPLNDAARAIDVASHGIRSRRLLHNCSGKHAGWIAASAVRSWPTESYLDPEHPIQRSALDVIRRVTGDDDPHLGVDGCGAPTAAGTVMSLARAFHRLTTDPEFERIAHAMSSYPALVADNLRPDGRFGILWGDVSKGGAEGVFAASRSGLTIVTKSLDGSGEIAVAAAAAIARDLSAWDPAQADMFDAIAHPEVVGGGSPVGRLEIIDP